MFDALQSGWGLELILWLQENRHPLLALLAEILDFTGEELFYVALIGLVYWSFNKALGMRMSFALFLISLLTFVLKDIFQTPRPYAFSDAIEPLFLDIGYGMPSGHVSISLMVWGYLAYHLRKAWVWALVIIYVVIQAFGRMIAGVHYPQDVIVGAILALISLAIYIPLAEKVADFWKTSQTPVKLGIVLSLSIILTLITMSLEIGIEQTEAYLTSIGLFLGAGLAAWLEPQSIKFAIAEKTWQRAGAFLAGMLIALVLLLGLGAVFDAIAETGTIAEILRVIRYSFVAFVALALYPWLGIKLGLMRSANHPKKESLPQQDN